MIIIDTNVLVASVNEEEEDHAKAKQALEKLSFSGEVQCITYGVLVELSSVLSRKKGREFASQYVSKAVVSFRILFPEELSGATDFFQENFRSLSLVDCEIILASRQHGAKVLSFDKDLLKAL